MFYTIYKTTNNINGKIYIGSHKTNKLDDIYLGSGKYLLRAIEKHGVENFTKEILFVLDNPEDMYAKEAELVDDIFLSEANTYNLKKGGFGGFDFINKYQNDDYITVRRNNGLKSNFKTKPEFHPKWQPKYGKDNPGFGKRNATCFSNNRDIQQRACLNAHSPESNRKRKETYDKINHQVGTKNSQYGTIWVTNDLENKKIRKNEVIPEGWRQGRVNGNVKKL
jgi:hypothetical protein